MLPDYVGQDDVDRLVEAMRAQRSHKRHRIGSSAECNVRQIVKKMRNTPQFTVKNPD